MRLRRLLAVAVVVGAVGVAGASGVLGPVGLGDDSDAAPATTAEPAPTPTATAPGTPTEPPPFVLRIVDVEACGQTCRDVTATLTNTEGERATGVVVLTTIHAGDSADGEILWEGDREVGSIPAGASVTQTTRIELGLMDAAAVQAADGEVTIVTVVESSQESVRFVEHRDVS